MSRADTRGARPLTEDEIERFVAGVDAHRRRCAAAEPDHSALVELLKRRERLACDLGLVDAQIEAMV